MTPPDGTDDEFEALLRESARVAAAFASGEEESQPELEQRQGLRRVPGFSTELQDISAAEYRQLQLERVVLVGVRLREVRRWQKIPLLS